jgi:hypothetical protein
MGWRSQVGAWLAFGHEDAGANTPRTAPSKCSWSARYFHCLVAVILKNVEKVGGRLRDRPPRSCWLLFDAEDLLDIPNHNILVKLMIDGAASRPCSGINPALTELQRQEKRHP